MNRLWIVLLVLAILMTFTRVGGQEIAPSERVIRVTENGLLQITDVLAVGDGADGIRVGFTSEMYARLLAYYVEGVEADIVVTPVEGNVFFLVVRMPDGWAGDVIRLVTVWRNMLMKVGDQYELIMAANPLLEDGVRTMNVRVEVPEGAEIKSIQGVEMAIANKTAASGSFQVEGGLRFKSIRAVIDAPNLIFITLERVVLTVQDAGGPKAELSVKLRNEGDNPLSDFTIHLSPTAEVDAVRVGFESLRFSRSGESLTVIFDRQLGNGESVEFDVTYRDKSLLSVENGHLMVRPPKIHDSVIGEYLVTVYTPPAASLSFGEVEPWRVQPTGSMSTSVTFRLADFYPPQSYIISFDYTPATFYNPAPALIVALIISGVAAVVIPRVRGVGARPKAALPPEVGENISRANSLWAEAALSVDKVLESVDPRSKGEMPSRPVDGLLRDVKRVRDTLGVVIHRRGEIGREVGSKLELYIRNLGELADALQALSRSAEEYRVKRLSRRVYERIYREYVRTVGELVGEINSLVDELKRVI